MKHILNVLVQDRSGVLVRVAGLFLSLIHI